MFKLNKKINEIEKNTDSFNRFNLRHYINLMTEFEYNLSNSHYNFYKFNKTNKYLFNMKKAAKFFQINFNSKGCLISQPLFNLIYTNSNIENEIKNNLTKKNNISKIVINLFY